MKRYELKLMGEPEPKIIRADEFSITEKGLVFYRKETSKRKRGVGEKALLPNVKSHCYPFTSI